MERIEEDARILLKNELWEKWLEAPGDDCFEWFMLTELLALRQREERMRKALEISRREYGAFGSLSGQTLIQMDAALAKGKKE